MPAFCSCDLLAHRAVLGRLLANVPSFPTDGGGPGDMVFRTMNMAQLTGCCCIWCRWMVAGGRGSFLPGGKPNRRGLETLVTPAGQFCQVRRASEFGVHRLALMLSLRPSSTRRLHGAD